jgi:DNA invertase Pin-like site-specific DNA recombinase
MVRARIQSPDAGLFSSVSLREAPSPGTKPPRRALSNTELIPAASSPQYLLPRDLSSGIRQLADQEFDRLLAAVLAEQKRRGKKLPISPKASRKPPTQEIDPALTLAKLNAVRAAFKAGVPPSRIARQFGISHADVRKALARGTSKRSPDKV